MHVCLSIFNLRTSNLSLLAQALVGFFMTSIIHLFKDKNMLRQYKRLSINIHKYSGHFSTEFNALMNLPDFSDE